MSVNPLSADSGEQLDRDSRFYDHALDFGGEHDGDGEAQTTSRRVPDWGGDELFTQVTRRRFQRPATAPASRRPGAAATAAYHARRGAEQTSLPDPLPLVLDDEALSMGQHVHSNRTARPVVTVFEHAEDTSGSARARRRPPRTLDERVGTRPDRLAAWAFALGLLLILLAVATADAAVFPTY